MEGRGEPWNLEDFAKVSHRILETSQTEIWQNFPRKTVGPTDV